MTTIPRSEQLALDELALKDWMTDLSEAPSILEVHYQRYMNIDYIHLQSVYMWVHGPMSYSGYQWPGAPHNTPGDDPPPWYPTLQDVEDIITSAPMSPGVSMNGKLIQILQYRGRYNVDLNSPLQREHITYLQELCNEFKVLYDRVEVTDTDEGEDEDAFDYDSEEDAVYPMEPLSPETLRIININLDAEFLTEADAITHSITTEAAESVSRRLQETETQKQCNSLCSEGVNILDRIMDTDTRELNEGDYLKLMNLFRDLHT
jgi:hypothetical protein